VAKRTGKFYFKNEKEVMASLGLQPTKGSGSGWIEKEDGQNEHIIAQLKSTDAKSIKVSLLDVEKLEYHASTAHKVPIFVVQFLESNDIFILSRPMDLPAIAKYIECGVCEQPASQLIIDSTPETSPDSKKKVIQSGGKKRDKFWDSKQREREAWQKTVKESKRK